MTADKVSSVAQIIAHILLLTLVVLLVGLICVNFSTSIALILGASFTIALVKCYHLLLKFIAIRNLSFTIPPIRIFISRLLFIIMIFFIILSIIPSEVVPMNDIVNLYQLQGYSVSIESVKGSDDFRVKESIYNSDSRFFKGMPLFTENRVVTSIQRGLFLREVRFSPLRARSDGKVSLDIGYAIAQGYLCYNPWCQSSFIEVRDIAKDSFVAAKDSNDIKLYPYIDTDTVTWTINDLQDGIGFAYLPSPYQRLRTIITPIINITYLGEGFLIATGILLTFLITTVFKPLFLDFAKSWVKSLSERTLKKTSVKKVRIIVSSKGDEKEIDIPE